MNRRRLLAPVKGPKGVAAELDLQAKTLRKVARNWCSTGIPPQLEINGIECSNPVLSYTDLIDDACAFEACASKLRATYP